VALEKQTSGAACMQGYSWDMTKGIWVDHGCRAYFRVDLSGREKIAAANRLCAALRMMAGGTTARRHARRCDLIRQHSEARARKDIVGLR